LFEGRSSEAAGRLPCARSAVVNSAVSNSSFLKGTLMLVPPFARVVNFPATRQTKTGSAPLRAAYLPWSIDRGCGATQSRERHDNSPPRQGDRRRRQQPVARNHP